MNGEHASPPLRTLIERWRDDPGGTYRSWFLWEERLKNFRSIRRGIAKVVEEIDAGRFGNVYKGSSLALVVRSIAEQRQIFKGADHAFLWKPKLRIPDIYESADNQRAFARFLDRCVCCQGVDDVIAAVRALDTLRIKGLGPAAANLLYFLHPTVMPPFNTAIVNGYNALTGARVKLGSWEEYLAMRTGIVRMNVEHRDLLSNDLGAMGGLLFDIGSGRYVSRGGCSAPTVSRTHMRWSGEGRERFFACPLRKRLFGSATRSPSLVSMLVERRRMKRMRPMRPSVSIQSPTAMVCSIWRATPAK